MFQLTSAVKRSTPSVIASLLLHFAGILVLGLAASPGSRLQPRAARVLRQLVLIDAPPEYPAARAPKPASKLVPPHRPNRPNRQFQPPPPSVGEPSSELALDSLPVLDSVRIPLPETESLASPPASRVTVTASGFASAENARPEVGQRRLMVSSGFEAASGESVATRPGRPVLRGAGGFGDASVATPSAPSAQREATSASVAATVSAEILDKPRPAYTEEARRLNVEGEVLLETVFEASGQARVVRVLLGLGHGLDEAAMAAARQIRFRPARRDGVPIDSSAVVHVVFQLAY